MIDYETYCRIKDALQRQRLNYTQAAQALGLHRQTVAAWGPREQFRARKQARRASRLDPFKRQIVAWLEAHRYSATQVVQRLRECGYVGGVTIVRDYVRRVRPPAREAFLTLSFAPGEAAQVDWGEYGTIAVGSTHRRLSFFVMVLCHSRMTYVEFFVSQQMEHFLSAHLRAFEAFGGCPSRVIVDNLKSAVLRRLVGEAPVFNPRYADFARHCGFGITACSVGKGNEKGRVERGVGYTKVNLLNGLELTSLDALQAKAQEWLAEVANVRVHGATHRVPKEVFAQEEQPALKAQNPRSYDVARPLSVRASRQFRVVLETNKYSVPAKLASQRVTLKAYPDRVCIYHGEELVARHVRSYDRHQDIEDPEHPRALLAQRQSAREQRLMQRFLALSSQATRYHEGLQQRRTNARDHVRRIVALAEIHGDRAVERALVDGLKFQAFSAEYVANILEMRLRELPEPAALQLTRHSDLLDMDLPEPDLSRYDKADHDNEDDPHED
jgi:transposase